jgi:spermidine synthase
VDLDAEILTLFQQFFLPIRQLAEPAPRRCPALPAPEPGEYDLVLLDLFSQDGNPLLLFQAPLYQALAPRLNGSSSSTCCRAPGSS